MVQAKLKLEIIIGYLIGVFFLVLIVHIVRDGWQKQNVMEKQESYWQGERQKTSRAFLSLLDLASTGELIAGWTQEDYAAYRRKRVATAALLQNLKAGQEDRLQRECIDSVCSLLAEKEKHEAQIIVLMELINNAFIPENEIPRSRRDAGRKAFLQTFRNLFTNRNPFRKFMDTYRFNTIRWSASNLHEPSWGKRVGLFFQTRNPVALLRDEYRANRSDLLNKWEVSNLNRIQTELIRIGRTPVQDKTGIHSRV